MTTLKVSHEKAFHSRSNERVVFLGSKERKGIGQKSYRENKGERGVKSKKVEGTDTDWGELN